MALDFKNYYGEWALITGASSGIGKALAYEIASKKLNLILVARRQSELEIVANDIRRKHQVATLIIAADISTPEGIDHICDQTENHTIGLLVLSAGIAGNGAFTKNNLDYELQTININIISTLKLTHHFVKMMEQRSRGGILLLSSLTACMPSPYFSNYAATKAYVLSLGTSLYGELKIKGIDVSVLCPGVTNTPMSEYLELDLSQTPIKPMSPGEVAKEAIEKFGKKLSIIPGRSNRLMAFLAQKVLPPSKFAVSNQKMMQKVLDPGKL
jgi:short-subunit dehydrogenase